MKCLQICADKFLHISVVECFHKRAGEEYFLFEAFYVEALNRRWWCWSKSVFGGQLAAWLT